MKNLLAVAAVVLASGAVVVTGSRITGGRITGSIVSTAEAQPAGASDLKIVDTVVGTGAEAIKGKNVKVHYTGWLSDKGAKGKKFDSSLDAGQPFVFTLGAGMVIQGWDKGVAGMKVGGKRTLTIPSSMGYGEEGYPPVIPPKSDLIFDVELLGVQ